MMTAGGKRVITNKKFEGMMIAANIPKDLTGI
jgi:hypothetical protein